MRDAAAADNGRPALELFAGLLNIYVDAVQLVVDAQEGEVERRS